jgi:hypothetical protein
MSEQVNFFFSIVNEPQSLVSSTKQWEEEYITGSELLTCGLEAVRTWCPELVESPEEGPLHMLCVHRLRSVKSDQLSAFNGRAADWFFTAMHYSSQHKG